MSSTSRTLKRLGVGSVGVCTLLATPYLGAVANAAAPAAGTPATIAIASQTTNTGSTRNDGTNTTVKISATVTPAGSGQPTVTSVRFSSQSTVAGSAPVVIGTDTTAPYSIEWPVPASGSYSEIAEALDATGTVIATNTKTPVAVSDLSSVHISSPVDGASIGSFGGKIIVSGTRSVDLPALSITAQTRDNSSGTLTTAGTPAASVVAGTPAAGADQTFSVAVVAPTCVNSVTAGDCDVVINAVATGAGVNGTSDEVTEAKLYAQTLTNLTVTPATASQPVNSPQTFTVTATDQNTKPIAGLTINVTSDHPGTAAPIPTTGPTGTNGTFNFVGQDSVAEATTYTVKSAVGGGATFDPAVDFTRTATLTTYTSNPTTLTLTAAPAKALYASQSEYTVSAPPGTLGTPVVDVCVVDQNGNGTPNSGTAPIATVTRTTTTAGTTAAPVTTTVTPVADPRLGKTNCYLVPHAAASGDSGQDVFNVYFEKNGTPGFQPNPPAPQVPDVGAAPLTLKFAKLAITTNDTQAQQGSSTNVAFTVKGLDGTPFGGRKIALSLSGTDATFPTTQPAGTTYTGPGAATCLTDANGVCNVTLNDPTAGSDTVTATDSITDATLNQIATSAFATSNVDVRATSVTLAKVVQQSSTVTKPTAAAAAAAVAQPGDAVSIVEQLQDSTGAVLKGVSTTVTLDHGFFTPDCTSTAYVSCTFEPAIANDAPVGNLKDNGKTKAVTSDNAGNITFTVGIKRDVGFDDNGIVALNNTVAGNGATVVNGPANPNSGTTLFTKFTTDGQTAGITGAYNGASVKIVANSAADKLSGDVQLPAGTTFYVTALDQFGNLVRTTTAGAISLTASGLGTLTKNATIGSYIKATDPITLKSTTTSFAGDSSTVTATWAAPVTTFKVTPGVAPVTTPTNSVNPTTTANKTDSFTVNLYVVDTKNLAYTFASTPGNTVPINTAVTTSVTVKDQKGNPVQGLPVQFIRSGPNDAAGNAQTGGSISGPTIVTGPDGRRGTSYSSGTIGTATVTVIVTDGFGNELSRGVQNVTFTTGTPAVTTTISADVGTIFAGRMAHLTVHGTPNANYDVFAANRPSSTFVIAHQGKLDANGNSLAFEVHPLNNVVFKATVGSATSNNQINLAVHTLLNFSANRKAGANAHTYVFSGQIYPANRSQAIFIKIGNTTLGQATRSPGATGKNWTFTYDGSSKAGQRVVLYSATASDTQNANGHSANFSLKL